MADDGQLRAVCCQHVGSETGLGAKAGSLPLHEKAVRGCGRFGRLCREDANENVGALYQVCAAGDHHRRADLGFQGASKHANHYVAGLQCDSSDSSASSRLREAALKSFRSSSVQESDQSIRWCGESAANRSARADNSAAVSGGSRRKTSTSDASRGFNCISIAS